MNTQNVCNEMIDTILIQDLENEFVNDLVGLFEKSIEEQIPVSVQQQYISHILYEVFQVFFIRDQKEKSRNINIESVKSLYKLNIEYSDRIYHQQESIFVENVHLVLDTYSSFFKNNETSRLSIQPTILSRLVEVLLSKTKTTNQSSLRKSNGAFHTPIEIINYINRKTLFEYLKKASQNNIEKDYIKSLVCDPSIGFDSSFSEYSDRLSNKDRLNLNRKIVVLINELKVIDPAMGASDFLVDYANLIFKTMSKIGAGPNKLCTTFELVSEDNKQDSYIYKKLIWEKNIFGIDLELVSLEASHYMALLDAFQGSISVDIELIRFNSVLSDSIIIGAKDSDSSMLNSFDIVIGNPPYINLKKINKRIKSLYSTLNYSTFTNQSDLYILFYELGFNLLKKDGFLMFITSDKWMKAKYGGKLRNFLLENSNPLLLIDLGMNIFEDATVDTNILLFSKNKYDKPTKVLKLEEGSGEFVMSRLKNFRDIKFQKNSSWLILSDIETGILEKLLLKSQKLKEIPELFIRRGIMTGLNKAYIIDGAERKKLIDSASTKHEKLELEKIIVPIINGKDIRNYSINWNDSYIINFHNGIQTETSFIEPLRIKDFPTLKKYFQQFGNELEMRTDIGVTHFNLRSCAYLNSFNREKIVWPDISSKVSFVKDGEGFFVGTSAYMMLNYPNWLLDFLNSSIFQWYFTKFSLSLGSNANRFTKQYIEASLIPILELYNNENFYDYYDFTEKERKFLDEYSELFNKN